MTDKKLAKEVVKLLKEEYPVAECTLEYTSPWELLVETRLAAQCTDKRVNMIAPALFERFPRIEDFASADLDELMGLIKSCGMYKTKAKDLIKAAQYLIENCNSQVPDTIEELIKVPGVGRKTANLIVGDIFKKPSVVVDTHCFRITRRIGLHDYETYDKAHKAEQRLRELLPPEESTDFCHRMVNHGREVCTARTAKCDLCCLNDICKKNIN